MCCTVNSSKFVFIVDYFQPQIWCVNKYFWQQDGVCGINISLDKRSFSQKHCIHTNDVAAPAF